MQEVEAMMDQEAVGHTQTTEDPTTPGEGGMSAMQIAGSGLKLAGQTGLAAAMMAGKVGMAAAKMAISGAEFVASGSAIKKQEEEGKVQEKVQPQREKEEKEEKHTEQPKVQPQREKKEEKEEKHTEQPEQPKVQPQREKKEEKEEKHTEQPQQPKVQLKRDKTSLAKENARHAVQERVAQLNQIARNLKKDDIDHNDPKLLQLQAELDRVSGKEYFFAVQPHDCHNDGNDGRSNVDRLLQTMMDAAIYRSRPMVCGRHSEWMVPQNWNTIFA